MASTSVKRAIIIATVGISAIIVLYSLGSTDDCSLKHLGVLNDLKKYQQTLDPILCEDLDNKIIELNDRCGIEVEEIDCG